ncbi:MAG: hypothetical protein JSU07_07865 [Bacteroidetes bacterium]|nr:hypothetical protein [Bacteroidota bacterium]
MKNKLLLFMMAFFAFMHKTSHAQCIMSSSFGSATVSSSLAGASYTASTCNYAAEYATITFSTTGVFSFSTTAAGDYITVTNASNTPIAFGNSPLMAVTIPSVGVYRMHISASGPTLCATNSSCRTSVVFVPLSLCSGAPSAGTVTPSYTICSGANAVISTNGATAASGLIYQWQQSASSSGPWTNVSTGSGYNTPTLTTISLTTTTYYQFVVTCTASALSATTSVVQVNIAGTTTNTIPYAEGFEGITQNNLLPNCSWAASSLGSVCRTYTVATGSYNQIPHTGSKYASFRYGTNASGDYFYSNGVYLTAGQTYSAGAYYITDGLSGWSNFSILYGTAQTPTALTVVSATTRINKYNLCWRWRLVCSTN